MKKIIKIIGVILLISAFTQTSSAQIESGKKIVGASSNLGFNSNSSGGSSTSSFQINASGGYLFTDNIDIFLFRVNIFLSAFSINPL